MTMNKKLYNRIRKYFYRVMIKSDAYYAATYSFEGSEQNRFTALMYANYINALDNLKTFVIDEFITVKKV